MRGKLTPKRTAPSHGNRSIVVAVSLLNVIARLGRPSNLSDIANAAGMSAPRTHRYLLGLVQTQLVEQNALTGRYDLGSQIVELGVGALGRVDAVRFGTEALHDLTERTRLPSLLCVWGTNGPTVIRCEQADLFSAVRIREGRNLSLLHSASGRIFLAFKPHDVTSPFVARDIDAWIKSHSKSHAFTAARVAELRKEIRAKGMASGIGEETAEFAALSAPVFDAGGKLALSVTLLSVVGSFDVTFDGEPAQALQKVAQSISRRLGSNGYQPGPA